MSDTTTTTPAPAECSSDCIYYCVNGLATLFYNDCAGEGCGCVDTYEDPSCGPVGRFLFVACAQTTTTTTTTPNPNTTTSTTTTTTPPPTSTSSTTTTESPCGQEACVWTWTEKGWALRYNYNPCLELGCGTCPEPAYPCDWDTPEIGLTAITYCVATTTTTPAPTSTTTSTTTTAGPTTTTTACAGCGYVWNDAWQQVYNRCSGSCVCPEEYLPAEGVENEVFELPCLTLGTTTTAYPCQSRCKWQWRAETHTWTRMTYPCSATCPCPPPSEDGIEDCQVVETACTLTTTTSTTTTTPRPLCTGNCFYRCTSGVYVLTSSNCGNDCVCPDFSCFTCAGMEGYTAASSCVHPDQTDVICSTTTPSPCTGKCVYSCNNRAWTLTGMFCAGSTCGCNDQPGSGHYCGPGTGTLELGCVATTTTTAAPCTGNCTWQWQESETSYYLTFIQGCLDNTLIDTSGGSGTQYRVANCSPASFWVSKLDGEWNITGTIYLYFSVEVFGQQVILAGVNWHKVTDLSDPSPVGLYEAYAVTPRYQLDVDLLPTVPILLIQKHATPPSHWNKTAQECTPSCPCAEPAFAGTTNGQTEYTTCGSPESCWPTMSLFDFANIDLPGFAVLPFCGEAEWFWSMLPLSDFVNTDVSDFTVLPL